MKMVALNGVGVVSAFRKLACLALFCASVLLAAADSFEAASFPLTPLTITVRGHRFEPDQIQIAADRRVVLVIRNEDLTAEEFAVPELKTAKVLAPRSTVSVAVGPLSPGRYPFVGLFHDEMARGVLVVG